MSTVNYSLNNKGVRLIDAKKAWIRGKNGQLRLNPKYQIIGKMDTRFYNDNGKRNRKTVAYFGIEKPTTTGSKKRATNTRNKRT